MKPQPNRYKFWNTVPVRIPRGAVTAAAFLAIGATGGVLVSQTPSQADPRASSKVSVADVARDGGRASRSQGRTVAAPATNQGPAAPGQPPTPPAPSSKVLDYQFQLQPNYYYCGPAATRIALSGSGHILSQDEIAKLLGTTTSGTNSAYDVTRGLNSVLGGNTYQTREIPAYPATPAQMDQLQADVLRTINGGRIIVANIAGHLNDTNGTYHSYEGGHYLTIVGYKDDGRTVKIADPANPSGDGTYWVTTINMANWISQRGYSY